jgi:hypothetical protein
MKIRPVGAEFLHTDRQTDMTKVIVTFRNFAKAPNNNNYYHFFISNRNDNNNYYYYY